MTRLAGTIAMALLVAACGAKKEAPAGGVSEEEAAALNNAAEMLDASPDSLVAPEDMPLDGESNAGGTAANAARAGNAAD